MGGCQFEEKAWRNLACLFDSVLEYYLLESERRGPGKKEIIWWACLVLWARS